jgi:hypothetical protein
VAQFKIVSKYYSTINEYSKYLDRNFKFGTSDYEPDVPTVAPRLCECKLDYWLNDSQLTAKYQKKF